MRNVLLVCWLLLPIAAWSYHEGPGQDRMKLDAADAVLVTAHEAAAKGSWAKAIKLYEDALAKLPTKDGDVAPATTQRVQIELAKARMEAGGLPDARADLDELVEQMEADAGTDPSLLAEARGVLARSQFYTTWLMRLEGLDRKEWEPEIEAARQNWRLLAEQAPTTQSAASHRADLEAAIRLSRMSMEELQGMPLPCQCKGCCSCNGKKPSKKKPKGKPSKGASSGAPPDGSGS